MVSFNLAKVVAPQNISSNASGSSFSKQRQHKWIVSTNEVRLTSFVVAGCRWSLGQLMQQHNFPICSIYFSSVVNGHVELIIISEENV